jgi:hypothetical protein
MYVCLCVCMYVSYVCMCVCTSVCMLVSRAHILPSWFPCTYACMHVYKHTYIHTAPFLAFHIHACICICIHNNTFMYVYVFFSGIQRYTQRMHTHIRLSFSSYAACMPHMYVTRMYLYIQTLSADSHDVRICLHVCIQTHSECVHTHLRPSFFS